MTEVCSCCKTMSSCQSHHGRQYCHWNSHENAQGTSQTLIRGPGGGQSYFKPKWHYLVLAASGASDKDVWGVFRCSFSWRFQWHHRRPWPTSAAGDIADLSPSTFSYPWQAPHLHGILVLVTGNKFIAGVVVTGDNCSPVSLSLATKLLPVSLSPVINCSPVAMIPAITENPWQRLIAGVNDTGNKFFAGVVDTTEQFITGRWHRWKTIIREYLRVIFEKIQNSSNGILGGLRDTDSWKKPEVM